MCAYVQGKVPVPGPPIWVTYSGSQITVEWEALPKIAFYELQYNDLERERTTVSVFSAATQGKIDCIGQDDGRSIDVRLRGTDTSFEISEWSKNVSFNCNSGSFVLSDVQILPIVELERVEQISERLGDIDDTIQPEPLRRSLAAVSAEKSVVSGSGVAAYTFVGVTNTVNVQARDNFGVELSTGEGNVMYVKIQGNPTVIKMTDNMNGTFTATYQISTVTTISLSVMVSTAGLFAQYYPNTSFSGIPSTRQDSTISFDWFEGKIGPLSVVDASVRWSGKLLAPTSELFTFTLGGDDSYELYIDGVNIITSSNCCGYTSANKQLVAGRFYDIVTNFVDTGYQGWVHLKWSSPSIALQVIPQTAFSFWQQVGQQAYVSVYPLSGPDEIIEFKYCQISVGNTVLPDGTIGQEVDGWKKFFDYQIFTGYKVPASLPDQQWILIDWSQSGFDYDVNGILFHTDETLMTTGTITFSVDGTLCPDTEGVGVNAIGGIFNCGLRGRSFRVQCKTVCEPYFAVNEIKIFRKKALSQLGTHYLVTGGTYNTQSPFQCNLPEKVYKLGSIIDPNNSWRGLCITGKGTGSYSSFNILLGQKALIEKIITITSGGPHNATSIIVHNEPILTTSDVKAGTTVIYYSLAIPSYATQTGTWYGSNVGVIRNIPLLAISKIIVLGTYCSDIPVGSTLMPLFAKSWSQPAQWSPKPRQTNTFRAPTYSLCGDPVQPLNLIFYFTTSISPTLCLGQLSTQTLRVSP